MSAAEPHRIAFADVVVDLAGRRVLRGGAPLALEPKAFDVLALLAGSPGRAFSRDEILDAVWGHRHVTPGVLNRVVSLLRHALGDDAHHPRFLHTVHGTGYRFDLPEVVPGEATAPPRAIDPPGVAPSAVPLAASPSRARRRWPWLLATALVATAAAALSWWWPLERPASRVPAPTLVVMPLRASGPGDAVLAAGLSDELIDALARIDGLRVIARESTALADTERADRERLARRLGASHVLEGSLQRSGEQLRVRLRLAEARGGRTLWAQGYDRDVADVLALQRDVAQAVAGALALRLGLPPAAATLGDAEWYRRYFAARAQLRMRPSEAAVMAAEDELRALVAQRPDAARAHASLAMALEMRGYRRPLLAEGARAEAAREADAALRLDPMLPEPYFVRAAAACRANEWDRCLALHRRALALGPSESLPKFQYALALGALGHLAEAEATMRDGAQRDPLNPIWRFGLGRILDTQGRHDEARAELAPYTANYYGRWFNAVWRGDLATARQLVAAGPPGADPYEPQLRESYAAVTEALADPHRWPQARDAIVRTERESGLPNFLAVFDPEAKPVDLIAALEMVRRRAYSTWDLLLWSRETAFLRRDPAFQDYLRRNGILAHWQAHGFPPQCRPEGDGARCE